MKWRMAAAAMLMLAAVPVVARADSFSPVSVGLTAGGLGFGVQLERPLLFNLSVRVVASTLSVSDQPSFGGSPWTRTFQENNVLGLIEWRPSAARFGFDGGLLFGTDQATYTLRSVDGVNYLINGTSYPVAGAGVVGARVSYPHPAVYLGIGGGTGIERGFAITYDAGVILRNGATTASATGPLNDNPAFQANLQAVASGFRTRWLQPILSIGFAYRPGAKP